MVPRAPRRAQGDLGNRLAKVDVAEAVQARRMLESMSEADERGTRGSEGEHDRLKRPAADAGFTPAPVCGAVAGCITCGDVAVALTVLGVDEGRGLALCAGDGGSETVQTDLVAPVALGDRLLVHAGTAIAVLTEEASG